MMKTADIIWIRHGATKGNLEKRYVGVTDEPLCPSAGRQLQRLSEKWKGQKWETPETIFCSPMRRCLETAEILYPDHRIQVHADLRERDFGAFEYKNYRELQGNADYQAFIDSNGKTNFPDAEEVDAFKRRCVQGFLACLDQIHAGSVAAFVVHGGTIMAVLEQYAVPERAYFDWQIPNGSAWAGTVHVDDGSHRVWLDGLQKISSES